jgi:hypothetical protein
MDCSGEQKYHRAVHGDPTLQQDRRRRVDHAGMAFIVRFAKSNHPDQVTYVAALRLLGTRSTKFLVLTVSTRSILASSPPAICVASTTLMFTLHSRSCYSPLWDGLSVLKATSTSRTFVTATRPITSHTGECTPCQPYSVVSQLMLYSLS